jgi:chitinase
VTVVYATASGTAAPGSDYLTTTGTLTFAAGVSTQTLTVPVNGDTTVEPDETVLVNLSTATNAVVGDAQGVATITNDDLPALTINDLSVTEGSNPTTATLTVTLTPASTQTVTVAYATVNGTATAGSDYVATTGTLTFAPGITTQVILVPVSGDTTVESDETVLLNLSSPTNAVLADTQGVVTITNDDVAPTPSVSVSAISVNPGALMVVTVANGPGNVLDWVALAPAGSPDTTYVSWKYLNDSTGAPSVGVANATLTFTAPTTPGMYVFRFFENYGYTKLAQSVAVIVQSQPTLTINDVSLTEGNSGTKTATFTVTLAPASTQTVTVTYATANGTATAGSDYVTRTGTLTFAPGITAQSIAITVNGDTAAEGDETLLVNLTNVVNADLGDAQGIGTLINDDAVPSPSLGVSATTVSPGAPIVVTVSNGPGGQLDWVALAQSTAPDDSYVTWKYLNDSQGVPGVGVTNATLTFNAPAAPGIYVFRLFAGYGFNKVATSVAVTVQ